MDQAPRNWCSGERSDRRLSAAVGAADVAKFTAEEKVDKVVSRRAWNIQFQSGSAAFTSETEGELGALFNELVIAGGTLIEIHAHTDNHPITAADSIAAPNSNETSVQA